MDYQFQSPTQFNYATEIVNQFSYNYSPHWRSYKTQVTTGSTTHRRSYMFTNHPCLQSICHTGVVMKDCLQDCKARKMKRITRNKSLDNLCQFAPRKTLERTCSIGEQLPANSTQQSFATQNTQLQCSPYRSCHTATITNTLHKIRRRLHTTTLRAQLTPHLISGP